LSSLEPSPIKKAKIEGQAGQDCFVLEGSVGAGKEVVYEVDVSNPIRKHG
jgi:hypothetical protein